MTKAAEKSEKKVAVKSNNEPLGIEDGTVSCKHTDILPDKNNVIKTVEESEAHIKKENVRGIHAGKHPKFVTHPKEK